MVVSNSQSIALGLISRSRAIIDSCEYDASWPPEEGARPNGMTTAEVLSAFWRDFDASHRNEVVKRLVMLQRGDGAWTDECQFASNNDPRFASNRGSDAHLL